MPVCIGDFISRHVYDGRLKTVHNNNRRGACRFVDVSDGKEARLGNSWQVCQYISDREEHATDIIAE